MELYFAGRIATNVIVYFKAFHIAGGCNKIETCTVCFQDFFASVRLQGRIGISASCVGNVERIANIRIYKVSGFIVVCGPYRSSADCRWKIP
jgi:hypothetical protein